MPDEIPKLYEPQRYEPSVYGRWLAADAFAAVPDGRARRYVIMMPLPNVTGALHLGHAMDNVMQDLLIRWHRMMGDNTLWMAGTDHAGIGTQAVVEKRLFELEGRTRFDLGRDGLVARIQAWKDEYRGRIIRQQQSMGCSCDWKRQRFTMDAVCTRAVREAFFRLFRDGLITRGNRLVNWDCQLQTAVSDDEIVHEKVQGHFWHLKYPVIDPRPGEPEYVVVATTRPETMLGDTAVAVHPDPDGELARRISSLAERRAGAAPKEESEIQREIASLEDRKALNLSVFRDMARAGRRVRLPLLDRPMPLIRDEWADPALGSGCVKITPGHDPNDYEVWMRHKSEIGIVNILNPDGTLNANAGPYAGLDRFEARRRVVADLRALGLIESVEDREIEIGHSDRSKTPIEPYLSKQWFVRMGDVPGGIVCGAGTKKEFRAAGLAQACIDAVQRDYESPSGLRLTFAPDHERYGGTYTSWLAEKRDWCISRQLWWGHRIPIWHAEFAGAELAGVVAGFPETSPADVAVWISDEEGRSTGPAAAGAAGGLDPATRYSLLVCFRDEAAERKHAAAIEGLGLVQDPDVLDTWFSSALWPMSTLGWPDPATAELDPGQRPLGPDPAAGIPDALAYYYPGSCLVTARDIITLWVARMMLMGLYLQGDVPFTDSFIHANIQDGKGERMSKSKGNGIDPEDIIGKYGADAMRYVLCDMQTGTQDIRLPVQAVSPYTGELVDLAAAKHGRSIFTYIDPKTNKEFDVLGTMPDIPPAKIISERFEIGRGFCTKLWNAARFTLMNLGEHEFKPVAPERLAPEDRWILSRLSRTIAGVTAELRAYNPASAIGAAREFFWGDFCDWYLEIIKPRLKDSAGGGESAAAARSVLALALDQVLRLFHPFVPFITEVLWERLNAQCPDRGLLAPIQGGELLIAAAWPQAKPMWEDERIEAEFGLARDFVRGIRESRAQHAIPPGKKLAATARASGRSADILGWMKVLVEHMAGLERLEIAPDAARPAAAISLVIADFEIHLAGVIDPAKEKERLAAKKAKLAEDVRKAEARLGNEGFVGRAPADVVEKERQKLREIKAQIELIDASLTALS